MKFRNVVLLGLYASFALWNGASAENLVLVNDSEYTTYYIDRDSLSGEGEIVRYRSVMNLNSPVGAASSLIQVHEMRCRSRVWRLVSSQSFSERMGKGVRVGKELSGQSFGTAGFVPLDGDGPLQYQVVCGTK
jgi:hypothetical protein